MTDGALAGIRVLDFGMGVAAGITGMFFADFGAEVIKVETGSGDPDRRHPGFAVRGRNKKSVTFDPDDPRDVEWLAASVAAADVCILSGGRTLADHGVAVALAAEGNGGLTVLRMPHYLDEPTPWGLDVESHALLAAYAGQASRQTSASGGPIELIVPILLHIQGIWAAVCVVAALVERASSGSGQNVTVTGINAVMEATVAALSVATHLPDPRDDIGNSGRHPAYRQLRCADDEWMAVGALGDRFIPAFFQTIGLPDLLGDPRIGQDTGRIIDPENNDWVRAEIDRAALLWRRDDLLAALKALGIPCGPMGDRDGWLDHPQIRSIGMRVEVDDPERGIVVMPGTPVNLTRTPASIGSSAPALGADNGIAPWPARTWTPVERPVLRDGPLSGVRVLNMGTFLATPYAGFLLAELGADVCKVEPPWGDSFRSEGYPFNRGMTSFAVDLKDRRGRELFAAMMTDCDILMDGMRPGVMAALGLDYDSLRDAHPGLITMSLSAFGEGGPLSHEPGVDMVIQAMSGMMSAQGGDSDPAVTTMAINDVTAAVISALTCVLALFERTRSGRGQRTWDSLAGCATFLQMDDLVRYDGRQDPRRGSLDHRGSDATHRFYRVSDGWIRIDSLEPDPSADSDALRAVGLIGPGDVSVEELGRRLVVLDGADALARLSSAGVLAARSRPVTEVMRDPALVANEFTHVRRSVDGGSIATPGRYASFSRTPRFGPLHPPGIGEHSRALLRAAGVSEPDIEAAIADGIVAENGPMPAQLKSPYR